MSAILKLKHPDIMRYLMSFLEPKDLISVGLTCWTLAKEVLWNARLWRCNFERRFPLVPTYSIANDELDWLALSRLTESDALHKIQHFQLNKRLSSPPAAKDYLGLFLEIKTSKADSTPLQTVLFGTLQELNLSFNGSVVIRFQHKIRPTFLFWHGENGYSSEIEVYLVDKKRVGKDKRLKLEGYTLRPKSTILGMSSYKEIGKIAHNDEGFYCGTPNLTYNYSTDHSLFRAGGGGTRYGMGSSQTTMEMPHVNVTAYTHFDAYLDLERLFNLIKDS